MLDAFSHFWPPNWLPNCSRIPPNSTKMHGLRWQKHDFRTTWFQNAPKWSQGLKKSSFWTPKRPPEVQTTTPKRSQELQKRYQNDPRTQNIVQKYLKTIPITHYTLHVTLYTSHFAQCTSHCALHTLHFTLCTSHFTLYTLHFHTWHFTLRLSHSIQPGGLREAIK